MNSNLGPTMGQKPPTEKGREKLKNSFIQLRATGLSYNAIAKALRVAKGTLVKWNRELSTELSKARAIELEALFEQFQISKEGRINQLGEILKKLKEEIGKRDFSAISSSKLLELILKYLATLKEEYSEPDETEIDPNLTAERLLQGLVKTANDLKSGRISNDQAVKNHFLLMNIFKVYQHSILEEKIDAIGRITRKP